MPRPMRVDRLLGEWGIPKDSAGGRRVFEERMEWRRGRICAGNSSGWKEVGVWAGRSCSNTTLPLAWIGARLNLGSRGHLGQSARGQAHSKTLARSSMP
jgi:hypothetical protein